MILLWTKVLFLQNNAEISKIKGVLVSWYWKIYFLKLDMCAYLRTKLQVSGTILTSFRQEVVSLPPPENERLKTPTRLGLNKLVHSQSFLYLKIHLEIRFDKKVAMDPRSILRKWKTLLKTGILSRVKHQQDLFFLIIWKRFWSRWVKSWKLIIFKIKEQM